MSRRVYLAWRPATALLQGCQAGRGSWGLAEPSCSRPALERAQRGYMFSTLEGIAEQADVKRKKGFHVYTHDTDSITSFIQSYFAANQKYPAISLVVRATGGVKKIVKKLLDDFKSGQSASAIGSDLNENSLDCMNTEDIKSVDVLKSGQTASLVGSDAAETSHDCTGTEDILNFAAETSLDGMNAAELIESLDESKRLPSVIRSDGVEASHDGTDTEDIFNFAAETSLDGVDAELELKRLPSEIGSDGAEASHDGMDTEDTFNFAEYIREEGNEDASDQDFVELLELANSKEHAIKKTAPLIELLQQTASGSRRVDLSAWKGVKKDLSWDNTLLSIMPSSVNKKQELINDHVSSCTLSTSSEIGEDLNSTSTSSLSTSRDSRNDAHGTDTCEYGVMLVARKRQTVLNGLSSTQLREELKRASELFLDVEKKIHRVHAKNGPIQAIIKFKTEKGMLDALKLKTVVIKDETLFLEGVTEKAVEEKSLQDHSAAMMSEDCPNFVQNTITIEDCPAKVSMKSIQSFFSVFGPLQMCNGEGVISVKFEKKGDKEKALKVHQFVVDECHFQIRTDVSSDELVIRLVSNEVEADKNKAMTACSKYGALSRIHYDRTRVLTAHYKNSEKGRIKEILNSLRQDKDLQGIWRPVVACEGFKSCSRVIDISSDDIKTLLNLSRELVNHVEKMNSDRNEVVYHTGELE